MDTHRYTHAHTQLHRYTHVGTHTGAHMHAHRCTHIHTGAHTQAHREHQGTGAASFQQELGRGRKGPWAGRAHAWTSLAYGRGSLKDQ